jgi:formate dehydrogenase major subunit
MGYPMHYDTAAQIMDEIARVTPTFKGVSFERLDAAGSLQWPCNDDAPDGTPTMHVGGFVRGKGRFMITEFVPSDERTSRFFPLVLTTGRILSQYNVGADPAHRKRRLAPRRPAGNPPPRCRTAWHQGR